MEVERPNTTPSRCVKPCMISFSNYIIPPTGGEAILIIRFATCKTGLDKLFSVIEVCHNSRKKWRLDSVWGLKDISMQSKVTRRFWKLFWELPAEVRKQAEDAYQMFKHDPYHRSLDFKQVVAADPTIYSARVGRSYRAMGVRNPDDRILWYWIGSHAEYDKLWGKGG